MVVNHQWVGCRPSVPLPLLSYRIPGSGGTRRSWEIRTERRLDLEVTFEMNRRIETEDSGMAEQTSTLTKLAVAGALTAALAAAPVTGALAADMEKCYGVAKAGMNDCKAGEGTTCQGSSTMDGQKNAWVLTPAGLCEKLSGGSLAES